MEAQRQIDIISDLDNLRRYWRGLHDQYRQEQKKASKERNIDRARKFGTIAAKSWEHYLLYRRVLVYKGIDTGDWIAEDLKYFDIEYLSQATYEKQIERMDGIGILIEDAWGLTELLRI